MKTFVINLERSAERRISIQRQLTAAQLEFEIIKAVDGAMLSDEYLATICDFEELAKRPHIMLKGAYGCTLSHYSVYARIVEEQLPCALVLEDDVLVQPGLKKLLGQLCAQVQPNEVILLFAQNNFMPIVFSEQDAQPLASGRQLVYPMEPWALGSAAGYIIGQEAARGMLDYMLPLREGADAWGTFLRDGAIGSLRCVCDFAVRPAGYASDIDYVAINTLPRKLLQFLKKKRVFPFVQLLDYRRRRSLSKSMQYFFSAERSPLFVAQEQMQEQELEAVLA